MTEWGGRRAGAFGHSAAILGVSDSAFALLRDLIVQRTGIWYDDAKRDLLTDKLMELVTARGLTSFLDYYYLLKYDEDADRHWKELMDRLSVPETYFWRQHEQLDVLARIVVPRLLETVVDRPLRIWSAACCTGEEPLSIAIALAEVGWLGRSAVEIVASDGSSAMIERAKRGIYGERSFRTLAPALRDKYFHADGAGWRVAPWLQERVCWTTANLLNEAEVSPLASADVIFCRNVFIYFSDDAIQRVVRIFAQRMPAHGYLFLGASESLTRLSSDFELKELDGAFVYCPVSRGDAASWKEAASRTETTGRDGTSARPPVRPHVDRDAAAQIVSPAVAPAES